MIPDTLSGNTQNKKWKQATPNYFERKIAVVAIIFFSQIFAGIMRWWEFQLPEFLTIDSEYFLSCLVICLNLQR